MDKIKAENTIEEFSNNNGRIIHGDALEVLQQIPDESIDLIFVDPHIISVRILQEEKISGKPIKIILIGVTNGLICASKK